MEGIGSSLFFGLVLSDFQNLLYHDGILLKHKCASTSRDTAECQEQWVVVLFLTSVLPILIHSFSLKVDLKNMLYIKDLFSWLLQ